MVLSTLPEDFRSVHLRCLSVAVDSVGSGSSFCSGFRIPLPEELPHARGGEKGVDVVHVRLVAVVILAGGQDADGGPSAGCREHLQLIGTDHSGLFQWEAFLTQQEE